MDPLIYRAVNKARISLTHGEKTLVIVGDSKLEYYTDERGLKPLLDLIDNAPEKLEGAVIGDRFVGRASAFLCIYAKVKAVFGMFVADEAIDLMEEHGCIVTWKETVPYIVEKDLRSRYKADLLLKDVNDPLEAVKIIRKYLDQS